jgi:hypothetical protein
LCLCLDRRPDGGQPLGVIDPRPAEIGQDHLAGLIGIRGGAVQVPGDILGREGSPGLPGDGGSQLRSRSARLAIRLDQTVGIRKVVPGNCCTHIVDDSG